MRSRARLLLWLIVTRPAVRSIVAAVGIERLIHLLLPSVLLMLHVRRISITHLWIATHMLLWHIGLLHSHGRAVPTIIER